MLHTGRLSISCHHLFRRIVRLVAVQMNVARLQAQACRSQVPGVPVDTAPSCMLRVFERRRQSGFLTEPGQPLYRTSVRGTFDDPPADVR